MRDRKVWLITGAGRGMGADIARAALAAGHAVVATGRDTGTVAAALGQDGDLLVVQLDVTDPAAADRTQAEAAVQQAAGQFGRLDILVNNAGLMLLGPVAGADPQEWDQMIAVNVQGLLYTTRAGSPTS